MGVSVLQGGWRDRSRQCLGQRGGWLSPAVTPPQWAKELMWGYNKEPSVTFHLSVLVIQGLPVFTIKQISESTHGAETYCAKAGPRADITGPDQQLLQDYHFHEEQQVLVHKNQIYSLRLSCWGSLSTDTLGAWIGFLFLILLFKDFKKKILQSAAICQWASITLDHT